MAKQFSRPKEQAARRSAGLGGHYNHRSVTEHGGGRRRGRRHRIAAFGTVRSPARPDVADRALFYARTCSRINRCDNNGRGDAIRLPTFLLSRGGRFFCGPSAPLPAGVFRPPRFVLVAGCGRATARLDDDSLFFRGKGHSSMTTDTFHRFFRDLFRAIVCVARFVRHGGAAGVCAAVGSLRRGNGPGIGDSGAGVFPGVGGRKEEAGRGARRIGAAVFCAGLRAFAATVAANAVLGVIAPAALDAAEAESRQPGGAAARDCFGIRVVDAETGRGVPLIELRAVNQASYWTDSAGWAAFCEPDLMGREVFFHVGGPGYEYPADGFGYRGVRLKVEPGRTATVTVRRTNIAERLYRITGQGIYRDSLLLGRPAPASALKRRGGVMGQDSVQAVPYRGRIFWLWGDTNLADYPLGNFLTTAAIAPLPGDGGYSPREEIPLEYLLDEKRPERVRAMCPWNEPGMIWLFGLLTIDDPQGRETLVAHYSRQKSLAERAEHGLARFDDATGRFVKLAVFDAGERWRHPRGNAVRVREAEGEYFYFVEQWASTRVPARWDALLDPGRYEAFRYDPAAGDYRWQTAEPPTSPEDERRLLAEGKMKPDQARLPLRDATSGQTITPHRASIQWNAHRKRWIMIFTQYGDNRADSFLGEVWYSEAAHLSGPWRAAVKIAGHPKYSFYNPRQHVFFDEAGGRWVYFEGTYTEMFSGNPVATPRYDYNQLLYRLDLDDPRLQPARSEGESR